MAVLPFITRMMTPKPADVVSIDPKLLLEEADFSEEAAARRRLKTGRKSHSGTVIIGALGIAYLGIYFAEKGFNITINRST